MSEQRLTVVCDNELPPENLMGAYVAIGNFDGLHRGHQYLIKTMEERARNAGKAATVLTFEPHPRAFFRPEETFFRLTAPEVKEVILKRLNIDGLFIKAFNQQLASKTAPQFMDMVHQDMKIGGVVVGHDFHFGKGREGTPEKLKQLCAERGMDCLVVEPLLEKSEVVSSSAIRTALTEGNVQLANNLLGYRWFIRSTVVHGAKRGRELGFPTANLELEQGCTLRHGVYSVRARVSGGQIIDGVASFGKRPMFDNGKPLLEVNLFNFNNDLYGQVMDVEFIGWVRPEEKFDSLETLIAAINADARIAQEQIAQANELSMIAG
ncbi:bifunctional riboflavin kinase/FAD synthetase [Microvirga sp. W0021]|uniref:Riboflavin biosynthesis protein n=1 Tax=Hohaiivirga grylli TaxID=3133970 RepID=A0ABV0BH38_9HYPH